MEQIEQFYQDPRIIFLLLWTLAWKGYALLRASKNDQKYWYVALLVINLSGLLEIIYLLFFQKEGKLWEKVFVKKAKK